MLLLGITVMGTKGTKRFRKQVTQLRSRGKGTCSRCGCLLEGKTEKRRGTCGVCHRKDIANALHDKT